MSRSRLRFVDSLRGMAALTIALHHLCIYGPLPRSAARLLPGPVGAIAEYGRLAVQVFLVISGFAMALTAEALRLDPSGIARFAARRYVRLGAPYLAVALFILILGAIGSPAGGAFPLYDDASPQGVLAHVAFLQDILHYPSLSAGFWYVGIEFQFGLLYVLLIAAHRGLLRGLGRSSPRADLALRLALFAPLVAASILVWNSNPDNDVWVIYYLGSLFLGAFCGWAYAGRLPWRAFWTLVGVAAVGLAIWPNVRLLLSLVITASIARLGANGRVVAIPGVGLIERLGRVSYSFFLVHYPTFWLVESIGLRLGADRSPGAALAWLALALVASLGTALLLHRFVERPSLALSDRLREPREAPRPALAAAPAS